MKLSDLTLEEAEARCAALETLFGDRFAFTVLRFPDNEIDDDRLWRRFIRIMSQFFPRPWVKTAVKKDRR